MLRKFIEWKLLEYYVLHKKELEEIGIYSPEAFYQIAGEAISDELNKLIERRIRDMRESMKNIAKPRKRPDLGAY